MTSSSTDSSTPFIVSAPLPASSHELVLPKSLQSLIDGKHRVDLAPDLISINPDLHELFLRFNVQFFDGVLDAIEVKWSTRMTSCAGVCSYDGPAGLGFCSIRMSEPLLKLRPTSDMIETLLHEMIHAYLFIVDANRERKAHGPKFCHIMTSLNKVCDLNISVYHSFNEEVRHYRRHVWQCDGPCRKRAPYFGIVQRAMNRAPGPSDYWHERHQRECGGTFTKVSEPTPKKKKEDGKDKEKSKSKSKAKDAIDDIRKYLFGTGGTSGGSERQGKKRGRDEMEITSSSSADSNKRKESKALIDLTSSKASLELQAKKKRRKINNSTQCQPVTVTIELSDDEDDGDVDECVVDSESGSELEIIESTLSQTGLTVKQVTRERDLCARGGKLIILSRLSHHLKYDCSAESASTSTITT